MHRQLRSPARNQIHDEPGDGQSPGSFFAPAACLFDVGFQLIDASP